MILQSGYVVVIILFFPDQIVRGPDKCVTAIGPKP